MEYYQNDIVEQMRRLNDTEMLSLRYRVIGPCSFDDEKRSRYRKDEIDNLVEVETDYGTTHMKKTNLFLYHRPLKNHFKAILNAL